MIPGNRCAYVGVRAVKNLLLAIPGVARADDHRMALRTGPMNDPEWVAGILEGHLRRLARLDVDLHGLRALELGPGNSLGQAMLLHLLGAERITAVDVRRYATPETGRDVYKKLLDRWPAWVESGRFRPRPTADAWHERAARILEPDGRFPIANGPIAYEITRGDRLPLADGSVDFVYSCSVLEHVRDLPALYADLARVVRPGGGMGHIIDLRDHHRPEPFDFLRYSDGMWNRMSGRSAGYTNRLRRAEHLALLDQAGFEVISERRTIAEKPPPLSELSGRFRHMDPDELRTLSLIVTLRRRAVAAPH